MPGNVEKFRDLLKELFQLDQADLDFGIYRIMNARRDEILRFLDQDLLPQVRLAFADYQVSEKAALQADLDTAVKKAHDLGAEAENLPAVKQLRGKLASAAGELPALEDAVFSHLFHFFRRYYNDGDFISQRRYKEGVYAIPYEGEEVKLYWANYDQYYIKSSETFRDYTFKLDSGKRVNFRIVAASTEQDNNKQAAGKERRFYLCRQQPLVEENGELHIRFEYRPSEGREKQSDLNRQAISAILAAKGFDAWITQLAKTAPTESDSTRTVLAKHLAKFTARNEFDYFIHKDLGGFLRRELDFYIKNEVMHLDDVEHQSVEHVEQYLSLIKVIRKIAHKIITFLEQLENFQKKLWLKKKFVIETHYCFTLDRVPEMLYPEIAANDAQRAEWVKLFAIDEIQAEKLGDVAYGKPLTVEFLKSQRHLVLDTRHFSLEFKQKLLASMDGLDEKLDGLLINGNNAHALRTIGERYASRIKCIYGDPPYNTNDATFHYKNDYKHSSWCAMVWNAVYTAAPLLGPTGVLATAIDDLELHNLGQICDGVFGMQGRLGTITIETKPSGRTNDNFLATSHEYYLLYGLNPGDTEIAFFELTAEQKRQFGDTDAAGAFKWRDFLRTGGYSTPLERPNSCYPIYLEESTGKLSLDQQPGLQEIWPVDSDDRMRVWRKTRPSFLHHLAAGEIRAARNRAGSLKVQIIDRMKSGTRPKSVWAGSQYDAASHGTKLLKSIFNEPNPFSFAKSVFAVRDVLYIATGEEEDITILDIFAGSGTTAHAVINLNREDGGSRKYILVEMGEYFHTVLLPRIKKVVYAKDWKDGKPVARDTGISHGIKYLRLESYEDALANLDLHRSKQQSDLLNTNSDLREQYMLSYMLDVESRGSGAAGSLLNIDAFANPDQYRLKVERNGETQSVPVDLPETFNYLLGLTVKHVDMIGGVKVIDGKNPQGRRVLVLWRIIAEMNNDKLDQWFKKQKYNTREMEYDIFYVNGDNNLENLRREDQTWKVRLIEEEFQRLMFEAQEV